MHAIEITEYGDAEVLEVVGRDLPEPGEGQVRIDTEAVGVNFADIQQRRGDYPGGPDTPFVPGVEAAGTVDATGEGVDLSEGDRVVAMLNGGGYAEYAVADVRSVFPAAGLSFEDAAGFPVQFLTAHNCLHEWGRLEADEQVLIHAAAGGVGTAAVQLADHAGAEVFGTASTAEKLDLASELGCDHPINYVEEDFREVVDDVTGGGGVDLVLDGVGGDTFHRSMDALAHFGRLVFYGAASGEMPEAELTDLLMSNKQIIGFHLGQASYHDPGTAMAPVPELIQLISSGEIEVRVGSTFDLQDAADAHASIEARETTGKVILEP
jgi:NADPH2:quinone reductase